MPADKQHPQPLTKRQRAIVEHIEQSIRQRGYPPSLREIGAAMKIKSTNGVNDHLVAIERKGYLRRDPLVSRGLHLVRGSSEPAPDESRRSSLVRQRAQLAQQLAEIDAELEVANAG